MTDPKQPRAGVKLPKGATGPLEQSRIPVTAKEEASEVSGQYDAWIRCPYCGARGFVGGLDHRYYIAVRCWACGETFLA
ncbi:MAG TPA: hypothetical protein VK433_03580 [Stellaceae bacterium]|nr:hypothetical protein [Stellaceae bacterium]